MKITIRELLAWTLSAAIALGWCLDAKTRTPINRIPSDGKTSNWANLIARGK